MIPVLTLLVTIAAIAFGYRIFVQIRIQQIEKHLPAPIFWMTLIFMGFVPVFWKLKNTSATILATRANICVCIFYSCAAIFFLLIL
jgi:hypothetical protein